MFPKQRTLRGYVQERYFENYSSPFPLQMTEYFRKLDDVSFAQLKYVAEKLTFSYVAGMNPHQPLLASKYIMDETITESFSTTSRLINDIYQSNQEYQAKLAFHFGMGKQLKQQPVELKQSIENLAYLQSGQEIVSGVWKEKLFNRISITGLERYASCPFRYGLERLLKVKEPLEKQKRIDAIEAGNMVHRIIEKFYSDAKGKPFNQLEAFFQKQAEKVLAGIFETEWELMERVHPELSQTSLKKAKEDWWEKITSLAYLRKNPVLV